MTHLKTLLATAAVSLLCSLPAHSENGKLWKITNGDYAGCTDFSDFLAVASEREVVTSTKTCIRLRQGSIVYLDNMKGGPLGIAFSCVRPFALFSSEPRCYWTNTAAIVLGGDKDTPTPQAPTPTQPAPPPPPAPEPQAPVAPPQPQATAPVAPPTLSPAQLGPLSSRLAEINQLVRLSLPIIVRHCGTDSACRKEQTAAIHELASKETTIAKAIRNPTTYTSAVLENDTVNACIVMWRASEDFAATMQCINDAAPTM